MEKIYTMILGTLLIVFLIGITIAVEEIIVRPKPIAVINLDGNLDIIDGFNDFNKTSFKNTLKNYYSCDSIECSCYVSSSWHDNVDVGVFPSNLSILEKNKVCNEQSETYLNGWYNITIDRINRKEKIKEAEGNITIKEKAEPKPPKP